MPPTRKNVELNEDVDWTNETNLYNSTSKPKRSKVIKTRDASATPEKRLARIRKSCPKTIQERVIRVKTQRFYLINRERDKSALKESFTVFGSTGNVYTVIVDKKPSCTCPDALKGNHCKHILWVFLKVLGVGEHSSYYFQKALLESELQEIFSNAPQAPSAVLNEQLVKAYGRAVGNKNAEASSSSSDTRRKAVDGEDCSVCFEAMEGKTEAHLSSITFCSTCGKGLHTHCFRMWASKAPSLTCVYCRAPWPTNGAESSQITTSEGYLNLANAVGASQIRDTSTYYQGYRRGNNINIWGC